MKRTLKRGLKVREIAKREGVGFSAGASRNHRASGRKAASARRGEHRVGARRLRARERCYFRDAAGQHRFARVGDRKAAEWKPACGGANAAVNVFSPGGPRRTVTAVRQRGCLSRLGAGARSGTRLALD